jgi:hypothetical protein
MNNQQLSGPVGIAIAAVALILVLGIGFWYMNRSAAAGGGSVDDRTAAMNARLKQSGGQHH